MRLVRDTPKLLSLLLITLIPVCLNAGCAKLLGSLRRDLDDSEPYTAPPTLGGSWTERGMLNEDSTASGDDRYSAVGHSERSPASAEYGGAGRGSWVSSDQRDANRRDQYRGAREEKDENGEVSYSSNANLVPTTRPKFKNGPRATRSDFVDESQNEGSLWASDGQTNYYFTKNKVRGIGDIVTITVEADLVRDTAAEVTRTLTPRERQGEFMLAQERLKAQALGQAAPGAPDAQGGTKDVLATSAAAPNRSPASPAAKASGDEPEVRPATLADLDVAKSLTMKAGDTILAEIIDRYPNGNYKIRGTKKIPYRLGGTKLVTLVGVVKGTDIGEDDTVASGKLYEYRLEANR